MEKSVGLEPLEKGKEEVGKERRLKGGVRVR